MAKYIAITNLGLVGTGFEDPPAQPANVQIWGAAEGQVWGVDPPDSFTLVRSFDYSTSNPVTSPNYVVLYYDRSAPANPCYMIVGCDINTGGGNVANEGVILVYQFAGLEDLVGNADPISLTSVAIGGQPQGMAIQPGTGDLYVATAYSGIIVFTNASAYQATAPFSSSAPALGTDCADLAFDDSGNLWLTSFAGTDPSTHLLTCFTQVGALGTANMTSDLSKYVQFGNAGAPGFAQNPLPGVTASAAPFYPLSEPNGLAFDPCGNLWVANNDDDVAVNPIGKATLLRLSANWFLPILNDPAKNQTVQTIRQATAAAPGGTAYLVNGYAKFGAVYFDGFVLYVEDEANNGDEGVFTFDTSAISDATPVPDGLTFNQASGITASYPGNGGLAIFNTKPASLLIRDVVGDSGTPVTLSGAQVPWESVDIGTSQGSAAAIIPVNTVIDGNGATGAQLPQQSLYFNSTDNYVQVRVANVGGQEAGSTLGSEILKLYWAYSGSGLAWPVPWDGEFPTDPSLPNGGLIFAKPLGVIAPGQQEVIEFNWTDVPNPQSYAPSGHFCLLARIEANALYPYDMPVPEDSNLVGESNVLTYNVLNNSTVAWRNIVVEAGGSIHRRPGRFPVLSFPVLGANYGLRPVITRFGLTLLDRRGEPACIEGILTVQASDKVLEILLGICGEGLRHAGGGAFHLHDPEKGLSGIRLHPNETLPFKIEFVPAEHLCDFVFRVTQYIEVGGVEHVLGGQTFVVGDVRPDWHPPSLKD